MCGQTNTDTTESILSACIEIGKLLTSTLDLPEILARLITMANDFVPAENWSLLLCREESGDLAFEVASGIDIEAVRDIRLPLGKGVAGTVALTGESIFIDNAEDDPRIDREVDRLTGITTRSIACVPLSVGGKTLGVLEVVNLDDMEEFKCRTLPKLRVMADYTAIAIENSRHVNNIRRLTITDEYTGLYNARHLHTFLDSIIAQGIKPIAVAFGDVDNFKTVVDTFGHLKGSSVLREIGKVVRDNLREPDMVFKYGGDEYVIVMPGRNRSEAQYVVETVSEAVRNTPYLTEEQRTVRLSTSFGIALYPYDADTKKDLLLAADHAMYKVKRAVKNQHSAS